MNVLIRWGALCGMAAPLLDAVITGVVAGLQRQYTPLGDYISQLGNPDRPFAWLLNGWWVAFPFLFTPFALALHAGTRANRASWITPTLLVLAGVLVGLCGVFHCDTGCLGRTSSARVHVVASGLAGLLLCPCPFFLWLCMRRDARWPRSQRFNLAMQIIGFGALVILFCAYRHLVPLTGLWERTFWGVYQVWVFVTALTLFRQANTPPPNRPAGALP